ncbi:hypothetical protein GOODEAATRI_020804 [Goodea atripinnis]|uniref:Uncharacterized protein n=1 Tax=Goodea atripinnis TaxID=208336 RepID=A0ABV0MTV0_9TELE
MCQGSFALQKGYGFVWLNDQNGDFAAGDQNQQHDCPNQAGDTPQEAPTYWLGINQVSWNWEGPRKGGHTTMPPGVLAPKRSRERVSTQRPAYSLLPTACLTHPPEP